MNDYILSRQILMVLFFAHCVFTYLGSTAKVNVPAKVYKVGFLVEVLLVTAYIVYTCIVEPFYNGVTAAIFGYLAVYASIWFSYVGLRHWIIIPNKIYEFRPEHIEEWNTGEKAVGGYITESGKEMYVYVDDDELRENVKKDVPAKIKYREWKNFAAHFDVVKQ